MAGGRPVSNAIQRSRLNSCQSRRKASENRGRKRKSPLQNLEIQIHSGPRKMQEEIPKNLIYWDIRFSTSLLTNMKDKFILVEFMHQIVCEFTILIDISKLPYE